MSKKDNRNDGASASNATSAKAQSALSSTDSERGSSSATRSDSATGMQPGLGWFVAGLGAGAALTWALAPKATQEIYGKVGTMWTGIQKRISSTMNDVGQAYQRTMAKSSSESSPSKRNSIELRPLGDREKDFDANHSDHVVGHG